MQREPLWIELLSSKAGLTRISERYAPLFLLGAVWGVDNLFSVISSAKPFSGVAVALPLLELAGLLFVASTAVKLADEYASAADEVSGHVPVPEVDQGKVSLVEQLLRRIDAAWLWAVGEPKGDWSQQPAPSRLRWGLFACGLALHATYLFGLDNAARAIATYGPVYGRFSFFVIIPFVYYPILAEFVAVVVNISVVLPSRIRKERLLHFEDPLGYAGLRKVGELVETTGRRYAAGLVLYTLLTIGRGYRMDALAGNESVVYVDVLYLVVGTLVGLALFSYPLVALHSFMTIQKENQLQEIAKRVGEVNGDGRFFPEVKPQELETKVTYMQEFINMNVVRDMHEYPVKRWQVTNVLTGFVLPYVIDYAATTML